MHGGGGDFLTSIPLSASTSYGTRNLTANSTIRHVVPFSRTAKMALSGLVERPDRFSPSCSASTTDSASTPGHRMVGWKLEVIVGGGGGLVSAGLQMRRTRNKEPCRVGRNGDIVVVYPEVCSATSFKTVWLFPPSRQSQNPVETP